MSKPIEYMTRTRLYYEAQGFEKPYRWAHFDDIPFHHPDKPVARSTVAIVTTAISGDDVDKASIGRDARSIPVSEVPENFYTDDLSWDKVTTHTNDRASYFPLEVLQDLAAEGHIGNLAPRFHFVPTEYSQRHTLEDDAPRILANCRHDEVDMAVLVPL